MRSAAKAQVESRGFVPISNSENGSCRSLKPCRNERADCPPLYACSRVFKPGSPPDHRSAKCRSHRSNGPEAPGKTAKTAPRLYCRGCRSRRPVLLSDKRVEWSSAWQRCSWTNISATKGNSVPRNYELRVTHRGFCQGSRAALGNCLVVSDDGGMHGRGSLARSIFRARGVLRPRTNFGWRTVWRTVTSAGINPVSERTGRLPTFVTACRVVACRLLH